MSDKAAKADTNLPENAIPQANPRPQTRPKLQPPYAVILHNDSINGFEYVVRALRGIFHYGTPRAFWLTLKAHCAGRTCVWSGHLEHAEFRADQLRSCGPDPNRKHRGAQALRVSIEPLPGA
jgi:ATP-dependent Clp protease adaptor protein ClpS